MYELSAESPSIPTSTLGSLESLNIDSLLKHSFQPDYTVRACTEVLYLLIKRSLYLAAKRATLMEKSQKDNQTTGEQFDEEVDKVGMQKKIIQPHFSILFHITSFQKQYFRVNI